MDFSKIKKIGFILLILFILLFPFWCVRGLCAEPVEVTNVSGIAILPSSNYFQTATGQNVGYFQLEKGYIYHIINNSEYNRYLATTSEVPAANNSYNFVISLEGNSTYDYLATNDTFLIMSFSNNVNTTVTREKVTGQSSAVSDLVDNVGIGQIWNIFDISINYIVVVVLFAFGCYIIFRIIRKISRGKEGL